MAEHYFTKKPTSKLVLYSIETILRGKRLKIKTASGIFSPKQIDKGTTLLINNAIIKNDWSILDLGCGYGIVGIVIKKAVPSVDVTMSDINERAVLLAKENAKLNKIKATVLQSDVFENPDLQKKKFDTILLNPPQTAGKKLCLRMIEESKQHLKKNGLLQMVARHKKGGKSLSEKMHDVFGNIEVIAKKSGYRIYVSGN